MSSWLIFSLMTIFHSGVVGEVAGLEEKIEASINCECYTVLLPASQHKLYKKKPVVSEKVGSFPYLEDTIVKASKESRDKVAIFGVGDVKEAISLCLVPTARNGTVYYFTFSSPAELLCLEKCSKTDLSKVCTGAEAEGMDYNPRLVTIRSTESLNSGAFLYGVEVLALRASGTGEFITTSELEVRTETFPM